VDVSQHFPASERRAPVTTLGASLMASLGVKDSKASQEPYKGAAIVSSANLDGNSLLFAKEVSGTTMHVTWLHSGSQYRQCHSDPGRYCERIVSQCMIHVAGFGALSCASSASCFCIMLSRLQFPLQGLHPCLVPASPSIVPRFCVSQSLST
jgi:hypothetical protein